jgi:uncharacterized repeat protein (TIGR01451 family)
MEHIEMNFPYIMKKPRGHAVAMSRLAVVALLGLMLWLSAVATVNAQVITPTSPCSPVGGNRGVPAGWTYHRSPDCSTTTTHYASIDNDPFPWALGNVPATPGGHTTFLTIGATYAFADTESLSTTITGLQAGRSYRANAYTNGNFVRFSGNASYNSCAGTITVDGASTTWPANSGNAWTLRQVNFVATGPTANLTVRTNSIYNVPLPPGGIAECLTNVYVANVEAEVVDADIQMTKTVSPTSAVASGSVLTYTLIATNNGPSATTNVLLRDTPGAGLDCTTPSPSATCSASGGASCPGATVPVSTLTGGGVTLPSLPVGGQVAVTMQCTVTATGR